MPSPKTNTAKTQGPPKKRAGGGKTNAGKPAKPRPLPDRITPRDAELLRLIAEHRVLTSAQITSVLFAHASNARFRIALLRTAGLIETFRPTIPRGAPLHCVATAKGLKLLAASRSQQPGRSVRNDSAMAAALRPDLDHLLGVNDFFCRLHAHARVRPDCRLEAWRSEWSTAALFPGRVRPDGFARWREGEEWCEFFLEYDTGTESVGRLIDKLASYADLMHAADNCSPVLFWLRTPGRAEHLRRLLEQAQVEVPVAYASGNPATSDIASRIWQPIFAERRLTLAELGAAACDHLGVPHRPHAL
jgi:hypothetical protein